MKIKVEAIVDTGDEDDIAFDGLAMEHSVGLLGTIVDWNIEYNVKQGDTYESIINNIDIPYIHTLLLD